AGRPARAVARPPPARAVFRARAGRGCGMSEATPADIAAVVVSYRSASTLDEWLLRLRGARGAARTRLVAHGRGDGPRHLLQGGALAGPRLRFSAKPDTPGCAVACTQGAAGCDAPWLAFLNPDLEREAGALQRLRAHAVAMGE